MDRVLSSVGFVSTILVLGYGFRLLLVLVSLGLEMEGFLRDAL